MVCERCGRPMRRLNPEPETWIRWTPLFWCPACHHFQAGPRPAWIRQADERSLKPAS